MNQRTGRVGFADARIGARHKQSLPHVTDPPRLYRTREIKDSLIMTAFHL
jgi:hypothetical protein